MKKHLIFSTNYDTVRIAPEHIVCITADGNYSNMLQADMGMRRLDFQLGDVEQMISSQLGSEGKSFIRIGRSLIVNRSYIYYINLMRHTLVLSDTATFTHTVPVPKEALKQLKEVIDREGQES